MNKTTRHALTALLLIAVVAISFGLPRRIRADSDLVATLETLSAGVEVKRVDTSDWVKVDVESLVGVGDSIRTDKAGRARVTFFANGTDTEILPGTEFRIDAFNGTENQFQLEVTVVIGQTTQRIAKLLDSGSSYKINSNGLEMAVRGTVFAVRVEEGGRSSTIVSNGKVATTNSGLNQGAGGLSGNADVPAGFGVRAEAGKGLSDVVPATSFSTLDSALDGCPATTPFHIDGDVRLIVRLGPAVTFPIVGTLDNGTKQQLFGVTETTKWYRIQFKGGWGWVNAPYLKVDAACAGLRKFPDNRGPEDPALYSGLESGINLTPSATAQATAAATTTP